MLQSPSQIKPRGFSLIETLVVMSIMGIMVGGIFEMMKNLSKGVRTATTRGDFVGIRDKVRALLLSPAGCFNSGLLGAASAKLSALGNFTMTSAATPITLTSVGTYLTINTALANTGYTVSTITLVETDFNPIQLGTNSWQGIAELQIVLTSTGVTNTQFLSAQMDPIPIVVTGTASSGAALTGCTSDASNAAPSPTPYPSYAACAVGKVYGTDRVSGTFGCTPLLSLLTNSGAVNCGSVASPSPTGIAIQAGSPNKLICQ